MGAIQSLLKTLYNSHNSNEKAILITNLDHLINILGYKIDWEKLDLDQSEIKLVHEQKTAKTASIKPWENDNMILEEYELLKGARESRIISKTFLEDANQIKLQRRELAFGVKGNIIGLVEIKDGQILFYGKEKVMELLNYASHVNRMSPNLTMLLSLQVPENVTADEMAPIMENETMERNIEEYKTFVSECKQRCMLKK